MQDVEVGPTHLIARAAEIGAWDWDLVTGKIVHSPRAKTICGFPPEAELSVEDVRRLTHPDDVARTKAQSARVLDPAVREQGRYEYRIIRPDGAERWLVAHGEAQFAEVDGQVRAIRYIGTLQDVTDLRQLARAEQRASDRLRLAIEAGRMAIWDYDVAAREINGSPELNRLMGFPLDARPTIDDLQATYLPGEGERVRDQVRAALAKGGSAVEAEFQSRGPDGAARWLMLRAEVEADARGAPARFVGVLMDITDRKRAQEALAESEARFRLMAEGAPVMMWLGDERGGCIYLNKALRDFWGVPENLGGFSWSDTLLPEDAEGLFAAFGEAMARQEGFEVEARYYRADRTVRTLLTRGTPRRDAAGRFLGMQGVNIDVTEVRAAAAKQRLLINELNHRVKNTLASVHSMVRQSLRPGMSVEAARDRLVDRLMALSKAHDVLTQRDWENAELRAIIEQAIRPFDDLGASRFDLEGPQILLHPNAALAVAMALHELATNAGKYGALSVPSGRVSVSWEVGNERVRVTWRESGGPPVTPPTRMGFGARLLKSDLAGSASLDFAPAGLQAVFEARLTD